MGDTNSMEENIGKILSGHMSDVSSRNGGDDASSDFGQPGANTSFSDEDTLSDLRVEKRTRLKDKSKGLARFSTARGADDAAVPQRRPSDVGSDIAVGVGHGQVLNCVPQMVTLKHKRGVMLFP